MPVHATRKIVPRCRPALAHHPARLPCSLRRRGLHHRAGLRTRCGRKQRPVELQHDPAGRVPVLFSVSCRCRVQRVPAGPAGCSGTVVSSGPPDPSVPEPQPAAPDEDRPAAWTKCLARTGFADFGPGNTRRKPAGADPVTGPKPAPPLPPVWQRCRLMPGSTERAAGKRKGPGTVPAGIPERLRA